ncbi:MAG: hypothetical protein JW797_04080 [Bradymonadales bacterium]|nr:hypothetical protein [Bradymonadales bacterium]
MMLIATCCVAASILGACLTDFGSGSSSSNYMLCNPQFAEESPCAPECDASSVVIIDGINYCTSTCGPNGECQVGHVCVMFGMFDTPKSACLPPCRTGADCPDGFLGICGAEGVCGL